MARSRRGSGRGSEDFGRLIGEALGEGIALSMRAAVERLRDELKPLGSELASVIIKETENAAATTLPASDPEDGVRRCSEAGCIRRAIARGMCRRHYARQTYREKKERNAALGLDDKPRVRRKREVSVAAEATPVPVAPKVVAAVPPMVRKRRDEIEGVEPAAPVAPIVPQSPSAPAAASPQQPPQGNGEAPTVVLDQVAKFFGRK